MKMRFIKLQQEKFLNILQGKDKTIISNLPDDVELIKIEYDLLSDKILMIIRSDEFKDLEQFTCVPEFKVKYSQLEKQSNVNVVTPKLDTKSKKEKKEAVNKDVLAYQKEFTPEQLELLRFKIEGDYLIVKPATYLKKEWGEINEVAKSIGGEWVKGTIISYWKIPLQ
jgi:hypothetical protein